MAENDGHHGWKNYPTWDVHLWLTNEEGSYTAASEMVARARSIHQAADALREWVVDGNPLTGDVGLYADILGWALELVDWDEVATALAPEASDNEDDTDPPSDISSPSSGRGN